MIRPPVRRGGYFKARSSAWMKAHTEARWTSESPAPKWWAELDAAWQIDAGILPSIRDFAEFLGWKKSTLEGLLKEVFGDIERWSDKSWTNSGQSPDTHRTEAGQPNKVQGQQLIESSDASRTDFGQSPDVPCARAPLSNLNSRLQTEIRSELRPSAIPEQTPQVHLFPPIALPPAEPPEASSPVQTPPAIPEAPIKPPGAVSGASKTAATAADVKRVWAAYREHHELCKEEPPSGAVQVIKPCLKDFDADQLVAVIHWFHKSDDSTCTFMRGQKLTGIDNILRIKALPGRVEAASKPWHRAQAAGGVVLDPDGDVIPPKPAEKAAPKGSNDGLAAGVSLWELAEKARATETQEYNHG